MYRNTASLPSHNIASKGQPPPNKSTSDSDLPTSELLVRKRQQIDLEIQEFKALKEKEFQDFERGLRKQRQRRKRESGSSKSGANDSRPGALSLLALPNKPGVRANGVVDSSRQTDADVTPRPTAPLSKPTTGVEKLSIRGKTLPPSTFAADSPPSPTSPSNSLKSAAKRPPTPGEPANWKSKEALSPLEKQPLTPTTPANEHHDTFAGVFTPAYLPLLDSRPSSEPTSPVSTPARQELSSQRGPASLTLSPIRRSNRSQTEPVIPSTSLPSALRTASGTAVRKRKHVTFQLADSAIVEPSSSYEELPSPSPEDDDAVDGGIDERLGVDGHLEEDEPPPKHGLALAVSSPTLRGRDRRHDIPGDLTGTVENGTGIGFFELDEELSSPAIDAPEPFEDDLEEETSPVETRTGDSLNEKGERALLTYEYGGSVPIDIVRPSSSWVGSFGH